MKIASFNINGIKARLLLLREWLEREKPDVIGLQELKADNNKLEKNMFADLGYSFIYNGQKSYNGVALISKVELQDIRLGFKGEINNIDGLENYPEIICKNHNMISIIDYQAPTSLPKNTSFFCGGIDEISINLFNPAKETFDRALLAINLFVSYPITLGNSIFTDCKLVAISFSCSHNFISKSYQF